MRISTCLACFALMAGPVSAESRVPSTGLAGEADAEGNYQPSEAELAALKKVSVKDAERIAKSGWGLEPLGAPGSYVAPRTLRNRPEFRPPRTWKAAVPFERGVVVCPAGRKDVDRLAQELKYHLDTITGRDIPVVRELPADGVPAIVFAWGKGPVGESRLKLEGNRLVLSGRAYGELSHALTYLLEAEGCRYLWPGRLGKVIPRNAAFALRAFDVAFTPTYKVRDFRGASYARYKGKLAALGISDEEHRRYEEVRAAAAIDHPGNRGFFAWHGCNDVRELPGELKWSHYFGDYDKRFRKSHPEFFALQPDGTRELDLGRRPERPRLCLSCEGLARQAAQDVLAQFRRQPNLYGHNLSQPDGGPGKFCLCPACRRLDPPNGKTAPLYVGTQTVDYVSLSDRVMAFNNRVAELVVKEKPDAKLTVYAYSNYVEPPLTVKPHPALIVLSCAGEYLSGDDDAAERSIAGWAPFGCPLFWRPNGFIGFRTSAPQVHARQLFHDLELLKANGVVGVDVCACNEMWANRCYDAYITAKGIFNPDRLDYATHRADWLTRGFGPAAAKVGEYIDLLDRFCREPAKTVVSGKAQWRDRELAFERAFDIPRLRGVLAAAESAADSDDIRARIDFLARGLDVAEADIALSFKHDLADEKRYIALFREKCMSDPLVWNPNWYGHRYYAIHLLKLGR